MTTCIIDEEILRGLGYRDLWIMAQQCMHVYLYVCIESVHVCTVHECLHAEVNTWSIIIILSSLLVPSSTRLVEVVIHLQ